MSSGPLSKLILIASLLLYFNCGLPGAAEPLQGGVEHSEELAPVDSRLLPGQVFDQRNLPPQGTTTGWYLIPNWYAGLWHRETQVNKIRFKNVERVSRRDSRRGFQMDELGGIWHYRNEPFTTQVDGGNIVDFKMMFVVEPVAISDRCVAIRAIDTTTSVSKQTNKIVSVKQFESFFSTVPVSETELYTDASMKAFDSKGRSVGANNKGYFREYKIQPFVEINYLNGKDLKEDFKLYLRSHGLSDRVPK